MCMNVTPKDFLQLLFGKCTEGCITITTLPGSRNEHIPVRELDRAAEQIVKYGMSANTYYGLALRCAGLPETVRGSVDEIKTVVCRVALRCGLGLYPAKSGHRADIVAVAYWVSSNPKWHSPPFLYPN